MRCVNAVEANGLSRPTRFGGCVLPTAVTSTSSSKVSSTETHPLRGEPLRHGVGAASVAGPDNSCLFGHGIQNPARHATAGRDFGVDRDLWKGRPVIP